MKLYYSPGACSLSPHIVLNEAGLPYTTEKVDLKSKKTESGADFTTINAKGAVPALVLDDGSVLTEGAAIVQYLADQKPQSGLAPPAGTMPRLIRPNSPICFAMLIKSAPPAAIPTACAPDDDAASSAAE